MTDTQNPVDQLRAAAAKLRELAADATPGAWRAEECSDEYMENCRCIVVAGEGDRVKYIADAETPELAARIVADHNQALGLNEGVVA